MTSGDDVATLPEGATVGLIDDNPALINILLSSVFAGEVRSGVATRQQRLKSTTSFCKVQGSRLELWRACGRSRDRSVSI